jgi:GTPase SAR1 family protein
MQRFELEESEFAAPLARPKMNTDQPLTTRTIKAPFPNKSFAMAICGPPGTGKSTLAYGLLEKQRNKADNIYNRVFNDIIWVCPENSRDSVRGLVQDIPDESVFDNLDYSVIDKIDSNAKKYKSTKKGGSQLLIIDDLSADLKSNHHLLNTLLYNRRHLGNLCVIIISQYITDIPRSVRTNLSHVCLFAPAPASRATIRAEFTNMNATQFDHLASFVWREKHDHLFIDLSTSSFFKNLQPISFK